LATCSPRSGWWRWSAPDSAPIKRLIQESRERGLLIDATYGRKTASILIMDSDHVVLSALPPEKLAARLEADSRQRRKHKACAKEEPLSSPGPPAWERAPCCKALLDQRSDVYFSVSATTREPRPGEIDGVHYHFLDVDTFREWIARDEFLEYAEYVGNFYGTPKRFVDEAMEPGEDVILDIEIQGAIQVSSKRPARCASSSRRPPGRSWSAA
jgi:regulator of extracellular matrix RemA (YlzA/DUF370 family)